MSAPAWRVLLLVCAALAARTVAALALGNTFHFADEAVYLDTAGALLRGEGYGVEYGGAPGQPVLLAALRLLLPDTLIVMRVGHAVLTSLGCLLVYQLADRLAGRVAAAAAALMYALDPLLVLAGGLLYPEAAAAVTLAAALLAALEAASRDSVRRSVACGLLLGIVTLLRPVALAVLPVVAFWIALAAPGRAQRRAAHAAAVMLACLLVLMPWTLRNYRVHGRVAPISATGTDMARAAAADVDRRGVTLALLEGALRDPVGIGRRVAVEFGHFWELTPSRLSTDDPGQREALHRSDPRLPTEPLLARSLRDLVSAVSFGAELALAFIGVALLWRGRRREAVLLLGVILGFALGYALFFGKLRYRIPILPLVFVFSGAAAARLAMTLTSLRQSGRSPLPVRAPR